ncbi:MAG: serine/threonine-protein kinase [Elusimicrobiota bacterium]
MIGKTVGGCQILKKLGEGGMGVAYQAHHVRLDRVVVIKFLYPKVAARPGAVESFQLEARAAARLEHPRITQVYDVGAENNLNYIVMQFVDGETAEDLLGRSGKIEPLRCLQIIKASLEGLQEAHKHGIVHRDIKPSNILLAKDGAIRLADFGLALKTDPAGKAQAAEVIGTPLYMAPEQIYGQAVDGRCDIYAMGATYFHMITGQPPFMGPTPQDIVAMHCNNPVPDARSVHPDVSTMAAEVIMKMMAKKPAERYKDVTELLQALNSPGMVVGDANEMMTGGQVIDLGIITPGKRPSPTHVEGAAVPIPAPNPGGMTPTLRTPLPPADSPGETFQEIDDPDDPHALNPVSWKPLVSAVLWLATGASAVFAGMKDLVYLSAPVLLTLASAGAAPAGLGVVSLALLSLGVAQLYFAGIQGAPPTPESLAAAGRAIFLPLSVFGFLMTVRLASQSRKSRLTIVGVLLFSALSAAAAFQFGLPDSLTWRVLLDAQARHQRAPVLALAGACFYFLALFKNRSTHPEEAVPIRTFFFVLCGAAALFFAAAANYQPEMDKQQKDGARPVAAQQQRSEAVDQMMSSDGIAVEMSATAAAAKTAAAAEKKKSAFRRMSEQPFAKLRERLQGTGALLPLGLLFLLFGAFIFWEDARIFEQEKML